MTCCNTELRSDSLHMFDQAWKETLMDMEVIPRTSLGKSSPSTSGKVDPREIESALSHSDQVRRKEPRRDATLQALVTDILEDRQEETLIAPKERGRVSLDEAIPVVPVEGTLDGKHGDCRLQTAQGSCSRGATCSSEHSGPDDQKRGKRHRRPATANTKSATASTAFSRRK